MSFFLSFEGIDGSGKTTQIKLLRARFESLGRAVITTREPGGTALAEVIRDYLLHSRQSLGERAELLLFGAARAQHVVEIIRPALHSGASVLCDRFADSSLAYQGGGLGLDAAFITAMNAFATDGLQPDMTFLLDIEPRHGLQRRAARRDGDQDGGDQDGEDRIEARGLAFQQRVRAAYIDIARAAPGRVMTLDGGEPVGVIHERIVEILQGRGLWP